ncbi:MAG: TusE/DsrC/DsvC family sulfur relay protein [Candidatus Cloacimonetes bacterium]|mgnify:CR=1 FL=1|jgi:tRNA 2-thiouridine synthesizing protein E|nr:TusE/DsrC/DsvC family sulfur relay protein [Candidatus Cloacimonadota bacterium]MBT4332147.1 TusE/DsrC/DsvC family sulfur relay protein [Candidatus Cloacimonadota bacterium]MBT4575270.1 TusE/DsrC/DsvC family sulfur relay protein [Candidatus Cloacimonadota bacterium]MBT5420949.1 TusE/DsrC/DsvC family sulfur relay protein [Candidatus Cloacimonadota bacterium]
MATKEIAGSMVDVNEEGFLTDFGQWNEAIAEVIAAEEGIEEMSDRHWEVIKHLQDYYKENGALPSIRKMKKSGVVDTKELYTLFPGGPLKKSSRIAGLKKPESCI